MNRREFFAMLAASAVGAGVVKAAGAAPISGAGPTAATLIRDAHFQRADKLRRIHKRHEVYWMTDQGMVVSRNGEPPELIATANPTYQVVGPKYSIEFVDGTKG